MQRRTINILLAILIAASLVLVLTPGVMSSDGQWRGMHNGNMSAKMANIDETYAAVVVTGMNDQSASFDVLGSAVKTKDNKVWVMNLTKPMHAEYFFSNNTGVITMKDMTYNKTGNKTGKHKPMMADYNNATINVAGASAIVAKKNITMLKHDNNSTEFQFTAISMYLPDGSIKSYTFTTPVRVVMSRADKSAKVMAGPEFKADLLDALKGGAKFPANAPAVPLKKIDGK